MRSTATLLLVLLTAAVLGACKDDASDLTVMTRNVYVGGDVDRIIAAESVESVPELVLLTWQEVLAADFRTRAKALADEIAAEKPDLIGLQEITVFRTQTPGDFVSGGTTPATDVEYDYLNLLIQELEDRDLEYEVAARVQDTDAEMPMVTRITPLEFTDVRMTDYDVILVRDGVTVQNVVERNFAEALEVDFGGGVTLSILRGFVMVDATVDGQAVRFVSTHLEPASNPALVPLQQAQAQELIESVGDRTVIVVGDLNSGPGDASYELLQAAGFRDAWDDVHEGDAGATCCFAPDLKPGRLPETRYDLVLYRNGTGATLTPESSVRVGMNTVSVTGGLYASDHAGVATGFRVE